MATKVVKAMYIIEQTFEIPAGINLEADGMTWGVKWNKLDIFKDGKIVAEDIAPQWDASENDNFDWKRPDKVEIADASEDDEGKNESKDEGKDEDKDKKPSAGAGTPKEKVSVDKSKIKTMSPKEIKEVRAELTAQVKESGLTVEVVKTRAALNLRMSKLNKEMAALKVEMDAAGESEAQTETEAK